MPSSYDMPQTLLPALGKRDLQLNFTIFNEDCLRTLMDFGSAVVYLTSQLYAPDALYIETSLPQIQIWKCLGVCKQIPLQELPDYLKEFKVGR
jgi:hypothetical protein